MDIAAITSRPKASILPVDQLARNPTISDTDKVKEASRQFEAIFLRQILTEARKPVIHSSGNPESSTSAIYSDMVNNQLADSISRSGTFGLAKSLQAQLIHQVVAKAKAAPAPATPPATQPLKKLPNS